MSLTSGAYLRKCAGRRRRAVWSAVFVLVVADLALLLAHVGRVRVGREVGGEPVFGLVAGHGGVLLHGVGLGCLDVLGRLRLGHRVSRASASPRAGGSIASPTVGNAWTT